MKIIKRIDTGERIVNLIEDNGEYTIRIISNLGVGCKRYVD